MAAAARALLVVAVPEEDGVVHGHRQLQDRGQRLGDVGYLPHKIIGAQVQQDHHTDAGQEHQRSQPAVQQKQHGGAGQRDGDTHVNRLLRLAQVLQVRHQGGHAGDEALFPGDGPDLPDSVHSQVGGGGGIEEHRHHGSPLRVEGVVDLIRQQLHGDGYVQQGVVPQHGLHMVHPLNLLLQGGHIPGGHILQNEEGERPLVELLQQLVLPDDSIHILRQIVQHVIVDPRPRHAHDRRDHEQQRGDQDRYAVFDHRFGKTHEFPDFLS